MSINLGTPACDAAKALKGNPHWKLIVDSLHEQTRRSMQQTLDCAPPDREKAAGYTCALRDLFIAFESATSGVSQAQVTKPTPAHGGKHV